MRMQGWTWHYDLAARESDNAEMKDLLLMLEENLAQVVEQKSPSKGGGSLSGL